MPIGVRRGRVGFFSEVIAEGGVYRQRLGFALGRPKAWAEQSREDFGHGRHGARFEIFEGKPPSVDLRFAGQFRFYS